MNGHPAWRRRRFPGTAWTLALGLLGGCIQGPWDFYPEDPPIFKGIWVTAYAVSGKPLERVCFERFLPLKEEATNAFSFFDSADVRVSGRFGDSTGTVVLSKMADAPNCFSGDTGTRVKRGGAYALTARFVWDSAGVPATSTLRATARVPDTFSVRRTAAAPSMAKTGGIPTNIFSLEFFRSLPPRTQAVMTEEYGDTLLALASDTVALKAYIAKNGKAIAGRLTRLLEAEKYQYKEGDTLYYLNGALNTLSHYFTSDRDAKVSGVLISHRFDSTTLRPETRFDSFFGQKPDTADYFFPGSIRRVLLYPDAFDRKGWQLLDSMGFVNTWFHTGLNRIYFYGVERAYVDFVTTAVDGEGDSRVTPVYNVEGGRGIFAGAVPDSFDVNIRADSFTTVYSTLKAHAAYCRDAGWYALPECRNFYRSHCRSTEWKEGDCKVDAVRASLEAALKGDTSLALAVALAADSARKDPALAREGEMAYCVENAFPARGEVCGNFRVDCLSKPGINDCKEALWNFCKDNLWRPAQCGAGLAWYCRDNPRKSEILCRQADSFCRDHSGEAACR